MIPGLFLGFSAVLIVSALMVVVHRSPVTSALSLVVAFCSLSGIYILMRAEFIGMVQIIVYAGAIMVLFLFVIMYLNLGRDPEAGAPVVLRRFAGWTVGTLVVVQGIAVFARRWAVGPTSTRLESMAGNTQALGQALYTRYLFPFEITSLVLLVAMVGAIVISKGGRTAPASEPAPDLAQALRPGDTLTPLPGEPIETPAPAAGQPVGAPE